jgi:hypothetical protein
MSAGLALAGLGLLAVIAFPRSTCAQDFAAPSPPGPATGPLAYLESGLPPGSSGWAAHGAVTRWFGLPDLETHAAALLAGVGGARLALGLARTGGADEGWSAAALALGAAHGAAGAALRGAIRRDLDPSAVSSPLGPGIGAEAGGGAWIEPGSRLRVWASAPQLWRHGVSPPLARGLEIGAIVETREIVTWIARRSSPRPGVAGTRSIGLGFTAGAWTVWIATRDHPLRGSLGVRGAVRSIRIACAVESHPLLGETTSFSAGVEPRRSRP